MKVARFAHSRLFFVMSLFQTLWLAPLPAQEKASKEKPVCIWRVNGEQTDHFLMGSIHLLTEKEYPLPAIYDEVYQQADKLVFEVPIDELTNFAGIARLMQAAMYEEGKTLKSELTEGTYKRLVKLLNSSNDFTPLLIVADRLRPGFLVMGITEVLMKKAGASPEHGLDMVLHKKAVEDEKPTSGLETVDFQVSLFSDLTKEQEEALVVAVLDDLEGIADVFTETVKLWKKGDADRLAEFMNREMAELPVLEETLLYQRNRNWIPQLEELFAGDETTLVIVGAGHLAGQESVIDLLEKEGYAIEQLTRNPGRWGKAEKEDEGAADANEGTDDAAPDSEF